MENPQLALVTGASTGIGLELAKLCAQQGFDLVIAANEPAIHKAKQMIESFGVEVIAVETDLSTISGVDELCNAVERLNRPVDALFANAGHGLGGAFLDQDFQKSVMSSTLTSREHCISSRKLEGRCARAIKAEY